MSKKSPLIVALSDTHIGGLTALAVPEFTLHGNKNEEQKFIANPVQRWIYDCYMNFLATVKTVGRGRDIYVIHVGDIIDGVHHNSPQSLANWNDQMNMACELLEPLYKLSKGKFYACYGTEVHSGQVGAYEAQIAKTMGFHIEQELFLDIQGVIIYAYHHGKAGGSRASSSSARVATDAVLLSVETGLPQPHYVLTGHHHRLDDSGMKVRGTRAISLPSWQARTGYGYKVASGHLSDIGGLLIYDGQADFSKSRYQENEITSRKVMKV